MVYLIVGINRANDLFRCHIIFPSVRCLPAFYDEELQEVLDHLNIKIYSSPYELVQILEVLTDENKILCFPEKEDILNLFELKLKNFQILFAI
jgi:hypothetical protein